MCAFCALIGNLIKNGGTLLAGKMVEILNAT
jgi:hypothetical protein